MGEAASAVGNNAVAVAAVEIFAILSGGEVVVIGSAVDGSEI